MACSWVGYKNMIPIESKSRELARFSKSKSSRLENAFLRPKMQSAVFSAKFLFQLEMSGTYFGFISVHYKTTSFGLHRTASTRHIRLLNNAIGFESSQFQSCFKSAQKNFKSNSDNVCMYIKYHIKLKSNSNHLCMHIKYYIK